MSKRRFERAVAISQHKVENGSIDIMDQSVLWADARIKELEEKVVDLENQLLEADDYVTELQSQITELTC